MDGLVANKDLGVNHMVSFDFSQMSDSQIYDAALKDILISISSAWSRSQSILVHVEQKNNQKLIQGFLHEVTMDNKGKMCCNNYKQAEDT